MFSLEPRREPEPIGYDHEGFQCVCPQGDNDFHTCEKRSQIDGTAAFVTGLMGPYMSPIPINASMGMLISLAIALSILIAYAAGVKVDVEHSNVDERPNAFQVFPPAILFLVMAWGMWGARYWAVLGFQAIMAIIMIGAFLTLIAATTVFKALSAAAILIGTGALFWFTVKALARIQMPTPRDPDNP